MSLFRRIIFAIFIITALCFGAWAYLSLKNNKKPKVDAVSLLPDSCLVYMSTSDFFGLNKKLNSQSLIVDKLKLFKDIDVFCNIFRQFDSLFRSRPFVAEELQHNTIHFGLYGPRLEWLATFNVKQLGAQEKTAEEIAKLFRASGVAKEMFEFELGGKNKLYFRVHSGVVLVSSNQRRIEKALQSSAGKLAADPTFRNFKSTLAKNDLLSVYINHALYQKSDAVLKLNIPQVCSRGFYAGVVDIQPSELKVNGYLQPDSSGILSIFSGQEEQEPDFTGALPFACNYFQAVGFSSYKALRTDLNRLQPDNNPEFWRVSGDSALYNLRDAFYANIGNCVVGFESGASRQKYLLVKIADTLVAEEHLKFMSDSFALVDGNRLFKLRHAATGELSLFKPLSDCRTSYAAVFHSNIYFSERREDLVQLFYNLSNNMSLPENMSFNAYWAQNSPEAFNYLVYNNPSLDKTERTAFFNFSADAKTDPFENFRHFSFSVSHHKEQMEFRWHLLNETEAVNKDQNILWALQLDTASNMKAQPFVNHLTKENELFIQDEAMRLYLLNAKGTVLWKKQLDEKITSQVFMVDVFRNNRYQALFSSKNQIHLIDRNGNYLPGYPVKLKAEASSPLSVFDYDNNKDYRLLIACKNNQIYNYAIDGKKQDGFIPVHTDANVRLPVQYAKVGLSDYLVALDEEGKIYTFSRRGDGRIGLKNKTVSNCAAFYLDITGNINSTYLIYADDKNSLINKISFADKKDIVKLNIGVENAGINFFASADRKKAGLLFTTLNAVVAYDLNGNLLADKVFENDLAESDYFEDESHSFYIARSHLREELLVIDANRQRSKLFSASALPLVSDLFNDNKKYLIITNGKRLSCVLLN